MIVHNHAIEGEVMNKQDGHNHQITSLASGQMSITTCAKKLVC